MGKICAFFGHGDFAGENELRPRLEAVLIDLITRRDVTEFYVGTYGLFERMSFSLVSKLKKRYPHIQVVFVAAYLGQVKRERDIFDFDVSICPLDCAAQKRGAIVMRNKWVVNNCDMAVCYVSSPMGGASRSFCALKSKRKPIINLADGFNLMSVIKKA